MPASPPRAIQQDELFPPVGTLLEGLLPPEILWWNLVAVAVGCALACGIGTAWACRWTGRHRRGGPHAWPESARRNHPLALALGLAPLALPAAALPVAYVSLGPLAPVPARLALVVCFGAGWISSQWVAWRHARRLRPGWGLGAWLREQLFGMAFLKPAVPVVLLMTLLGPVPFGGGSLLALAAGLAMLVLAFSPQALLLWMRLGFLERARGSWVDNAHRRADELGAQLDSVWVLDYSQANAFALFGPRAMVLTEAMIEVLSEDQCERVIEHELAHLAEPRNRQLMFLGRSALVLPFGLLPALLTSFGVLGASVPLLVSVGLLLLSNRMLRGLEQRADVAGSSEADGVVRQPLKGEDLEVATVDSESGGRAGQVYAGALVELYRANDAPAVMGRKAAHPDLVDRVEAAGLAWEGPRPEPPPATALREVLIPIFGSLLALILVWQFVTSRAFDERWEGPEGALACLRWAGGDAWALSELAGHAADRGDHAAAGRLGRAAWSLWLKEPNPLGADGAWLALDLGGTCVGGGADFSRQACEHWLEVAAQAEGIEPGARDYFDADLGLLACDLGQLELASACLGRIDVDSDQAAPESSEDPWWQVRLAALCRALGDRDRGDGHLARARELTREDLADAQRVEEFWGELARRPGLRAIRR